MQAQASPLRGRQSPSPAYPIAMPPYSFQLFGLAVSALRSGVARLRRPESLTVALPPGDCASRSPACSGADRAGL
jgi:hypothetical protein